ncbi:MAG: hypothetical protein ABFC38_07240 [Methanospirillum sp.]
MNNNIDGPSTFSPPPVAVADDQSNAPLSHEAGSSRRESERPALRASAIR